MKLAESVRELAACPRCGAAVLVKCQTRTGRNHTPRVHAAIVAAMGLPGRIDRDGAYHRPIGK